VFEETGLRIKWPVPFGLASDPRHETITFPNGDVTQNFSLLFHAARPKGATKFSPDETLELGWFAPGALPKDIMPNSLRTIRAYLRFRKTGKFQMI
jgi:8-oxo-dGTP pyrophosphatase MutT (NUDIX family)